MSEPLHVTFVCTGNICRSPMAEKVFADQLQRRGLGDAVRVTSAGTGNWHVGSRADDRATRVLLAHALEQLRPLPERILMVGDRSHDVHGAAAHGIDTVVVGWGYGRDDFPGGATAAGPTVVTHAATVDELRAVLGV